MWGNSSSYRKKINKSGWVFWLSFFKTDKVFRYEICLLILRDTCLMWRTGGGHNPVRTKERINIWAYEHMLDPESLTSQLNIYPHVHVGGNKLQIKKMGYKIMFMLPGPRRMRVESIFQLCAQPVWLISP